ncbi:helix-turn-helix transcriptional regulator [Thiohalobacter thiocyanaticus]|uniref:AlpA family phage regulatory protein n=1 Tax=Thiohalobacter thiocyanaticus TaxID=585455 RepID=A0A426QFJ3_9GAMM|nr:AlpA family phage regulatory protein [Thiohalobacter thiocyanaticus]RRQ20528.1 AlpA family phage regulatory protein [Thiohalobacter thiocyanaticus]
MHYISDRKLAERLEVSRATLWRWTAAGNFPQPIKLSPGCTRWRLEDVESWEADRLKGTAA